MTRTYLPDNFDELMRRTIDEGVEGSKVDFKREISFSGEEFSELLIDICSIVNTDDDAYFDGAGYLIIGVDREGNFYGLGDNFNADALGGRLNEVINKYISPPIALHVYGPLQHENGEFAVLQIPPSLEQPHMVVKETGKAVRGRWWVRNGESKDYAGPEHYSRVLRKGIERATEPLRREVAVVRGLYENLEQRLERAQVSSLQTSHAVLADSPHLSAAAKIRAQYATSDIALRQALHVELLTFLNNFEQEFPDSSVEVEIREPEKLKEKISAIEQLTHPLGEALATAVLVGNGELDDVVGQSLVKVMTDTLTFPRYGSLTDTVEKLRSYPIVLLTFAVCAAAINVRRISWLPRYLKVETRQFLQNYGQSEMLIPTRKFFDWEGIVNSLYRQQGRSCAPAYAFLVDAVLGEKSWLTGIDPFTDKSELAYKTELLQSLIFMSGESENIYGNSPIPNTFIYRFDANQIVSSILNKDADLLQEVITEPLKNAMKRLIECASNYRGPDGMLGCHSRLTLEALAGL